MEKYEKEKLAKIEKDIKEMPEKAQEAVYWTVNHFDFVKEMCQNPEMTNEEIEKYKEDAKEKEDYIMFALLCAAQTFRKESNETEKQ